MVEHTFQLKHKICCTNLSADFKAIYLTLIAHLCHIVASDCTIIARKGEIYGQLQLLNIPDDGVYNKFNIKALSTIHSFSLKACSE